MIHVIHALTQSSLRIAAGGSLSVQERRELDRLLELVDQLTLLKTRARYTLSQFKVEAAGS
jgi:hypothetical protein